ncbi:hypothetical protein [Chryseobacterium contaminans]|uniref:hypothetical protein n=1 Tax=Chryseobacterium contaminans TaxID=1423959 RepID=UPI0030162632
MIIYYVKEGQSFADLCNEIQLENPECLKEYHNRNCSLSERFTGDIVQGMKIYIPSSSEILELNKKKETIIKVFMISRLKENFFLTLNSGKVLTKLPRLPIQMIQSLRSMKTK